MLRPLALLLLAGSIATASSASAEVADPGQAYRVIGVASGDVLNMRAQPAASAEKVGALAAGAQDVTISGAHVDVEGTIWWKLASPSAGGSSAWVNARYLAPVEGAPGAPDFPLRCTGTEPFWSVSIVGDRATYAAPDAPEVSWKASGWTSTPNRQDRFVVRVQDTERTGYAVVSRELCSDGMSDIVYPLGIVLIRPDGDPLAGCCERAAP